ncbi:hypothetical protein [Burkholderia sp. LMG 32019]|uniref:hypothetical protein n=1 Tax=Burkholderia sp. LMG 32019 TaxID=3158173 RepID=UPI003C3082E1
MSDVSDFAAKANGILAGPRSVRHYRTQLATYPLRATAIVRSGSPRVIFQEDAALTTPIPPGPDLRICMSYQHRKKASEARWSSGA